MANKPNIIALIVAAGASERLGGELPKPYLPLGSKPLLRHSIDAFLTHPGIDGVRVVINRAHHPLYRKITSGLNIFPCVIGGATRQESVKRGLEALAHRNPTHVLIHDAARPMVSHAVISRVIEGLKKSPAVLPIIGVEDTIRGPQGLLDRSQLFAAQTPQGFEYVGILKAHQQFAAEAVTDDIALAERAGMLVQNVAGEKQNSKVTTKEDLHLMNAHFDSAPETRVGLGFDVHPFVPHDASLPAGKRTIMLCGLPVPHDAGLKGHSDADAGLHALTDALLGAVGAGDIGLHFPSDDPKWAGADSSRFLLHAYQLVRERGGEITNLDITIICEKPHVSPHRAKMQDRIADLLKIAPDRVNVKATTTEKLGFTGRGEGIAAQAIVSIRMRNT